MKKTLALVLAFALVFSTMTMAFAEDAAVGADAKVCTDLGMLVGDGSGVTANYLTTTPTRIQAAVMVLRLKGLEADAKAFTGTENFADADKAAWAKPIMAYLKANPQLGWAGDGKNFDPAGKMTAQAYYKVMLETLGYKQNTDKVVGDFAWEKVIEFAASKGLTKAAAATNFTVSDLAAATVETLKANVKDTTKSLVATLVEAGKVDKAKAEAAGVLAGATTGAAELDSVIASANDKVEATFSADVDKAFAENVANYKVVVKGSTTALEVKAAKAVSTTMVELTTAAQTGGTAYTMTVGTASLNFAGLAKNSSAPEIDTVKCIDTNTVEIVFKKAVDRASAEDVANYTLNNGATVKKSELWIDQDDSRKTVKLTTEGVAKNKVYKIKVANVKSADLVALKSVEKSFTGITDTTAPKLSNVVVVNNQRIFVVFDDERGVDQASVEDLANWSIDGLKINKVSAKDYISYNGNTYGRSSATADVDNYAYYDAVEISTEPMTANHKYTMTITNLIDGSTGKNAVAKALTKSFYGVAVDKTAPKAGTIVVSGDSMVEIPFTETNRLDTATATDINNYSFNEGLKVLSASILRSSKPDTGNGKLVVLKTSTMDKDTTYKISIKGVADEFGNVMSDVTNRAIPRVTVGDAITPPSVESVTWADKNTIDINLTKRVDIDSAEELANYVISGGIGSPKSATALGGYGYMTVELVTPDLEANKNYTITINGVKDRLGNEMTNAKGYFTAGVASPDTDAPEIENIVAVDSREIQMTFDEKVMADPAAALVLYKVKSDGSLDKTAPATVNATVSGIAKPNYTIDGNMTVVFVTNKPLTTGEYAVDTMTGITDKFNNVYKAPAADGDKETFYGSADAVEKPEVNTVDQLAVNRLQVTFSKPVIFKNEAGVRTSTIAWAGYSIKIDPDNLQTTEGLSIVDITKVGSSFTASSTAKSLDLSNIVDYTGTDLSTADKSYKYATQLEDKDDPVIEYVESTDTNTVQVHFNESIDENFLGGYAIKGKFGNSTTEATKTVTVGNIAANGDDDAVVDVTVGDLGMNKGEVYTIIPKAEARDIAGNKSVIKEISFEFVASSVEPTDYIKGVAIVDARTLEVRTTCDITPAAVDVTNADEVSIKNTAAFVVGSTTAVTVYLTEPLLEDTDYTVSVAGLGDFTITGQYSDGGIEISDTYVITFSGSNITDYVAKVVYDKVTYYVKDLNAAKLYTDATYAVEAGAFGTVVGGDYIIEVYKNGGKAPIYAKLIEQ